MKILHVGKYYYPYNGGMESIVRDMCEGLHDKGHDVSVLCSHTSFKTTKEVIKGVKITRVGRTGVFFGQNINPTFFKHLHKMAKNVDLVHVHCPHPQAEALCLTLPKSVPIVVTYHSDVVRQKFLLKFYRPFFQKFLNRVQKIFVPTENHIIYSQFLPDYREKCEVIPFGIRENFLKSSEANLEEAKKARREYGPYALFVGRLVGYKGLPVLLEAAKKISQKIVIVGEGPEKGSLEKLVRDNNLQDQVHILGKVKDKDQFVGLYHGCDMLVLPSVTPNENFGVVQLEAMACGKPVVTTDLKSGVPVVGVKGKTSLIVEPGNSEQLANAMTMIFNNPDLKSKLGQAGRKRFEDIYTWAQMITGQISSYKKTKEIHKIISKHSQKKSA